MTSVKTTERTDGIATTSDWIIFAVTVVLGGSSFAMIREAVETVPPVVVAIGRLWIGSVFLYFVMRQARMRFPALLTETPNGKRFCVEWRWMIAVGVIGYVGPYFMFPWAQQFVESGMAAVYVTLMPILTVIMAYFFANEALGSRKVAGLILGFSGVMILIVPEAITGRSNSGLLAQSALFIATICYAAYAILTRKAPPIRPRVFAAGTILSAAIIASPALFFTDINVSRWSLLGVANVVLLGLGSTGFVGILLIVLIQRVGAGFMGLIHYFTPVWAVIIGAIIFEERLDLSVVIALAIILTGAALSQHKPNRTA